MKVKDLERKLDSFPSTSIAYIKVGDSLFKIKDLILKTDLTKDNHIESTVFIEAGDNFY